MPLPAHPATDPTITTSRRRRRPRTAVLVLIATLLAAFFMTTRHGAQTAAAAADPPVPARGHLTSTQVTAGAKAFFAGRVPTDHRRRTVVLEQRVGGVWEPVTAARTRPDGRYRLRVPTWWYARHPFRVSAPATATLRAAQTSAGRLMVRPPYRPAGRATSMQLLTPRFLWSHCTTPVLRYRVNVAVLPERRRRPAIGAVRRAAQEMAAATGFRFRYVGRTRAHPTMKAPNTRWPQGIEVVIAFAPGATFTNGIIGDAAPTLAYPTTTTGVAQVARGLVRLNAGALRRADFSSAGIGSVTMHELGHVMGLYHAPSPNQKMYAIANAVGPTWGAGDLAALRKQGANQPCTTAYAQDIVKAEAVAQP